MSNLPKPIDPKFFAECSKITEEYEKLWGRWHTDSQLLHIITEVCELQDVIRNKKDKYGTYLSENHLWHLKDELADVFLTAFATANILGISVEDLNISLISKLAEVKQRVEKLQKESKDFAHKAVGKIK